MGYGKPTLQRAFHAEQDTLSLCQRPPGILGESAMKSVRADIEGDRRRSVNKTDG